VLCGTPLAEIDEWDAAAELPPLPPLPDGGLGASMPSWLRQPPGGDPAPAAPAVPAVGHSGLAPLGPRADPRTFLVDEDFPRWLRDLAARRATETPAHDGLESVDDAPEAGPPTESDHHSPEGWPSWPGASDAASPGEPAGTISGAAPVMTVPAAGAARDPESAADFAQDGRPPASVLAARALEERRTRGSWETLLLVVLFIGVIVAALWALVSNGVFSPSL
jgi:hypothetical protein